MTMITMLTKPLKIGVLSFTNEVLFIGDIFLPNEYLLSRSKRVAAIIQPNNSFVVYHSNKPIWAPDSKGKQGNGYVHYVEMVLRLYRIPAEYGALSALARL